MQVTRGPWTCSEKGEFTYPLPANEQRILQYVWMMLQIVEERLHNKLNDTGRTPS